MKKLLVTLDEETADLLAKEKNKSETIRQAVKYIKLDISTDTLKGMRLAYQAIVQKLIEIDKKIDFLAGTDKTEPTIKETPVSILMGKPCCQDETPCKHWVWDQNKVAHVNSLTGEMREVE